MINWNVLLDILPYQDLVEFNSSKPICPKCFSNKVCSPDGNIYLANQQQYSIYCENCSYEDDWWKFHEKINSLVEQLEEVHNMKDALS